MKGRHVVMLSGLVMVGMQFGDSLAADPKREGAPSLGELARPRESRSQGKARSYSDRDLPSRGKNTPARGEEVGQERGRSGREPSGRQAILRRLENAATLVERAQARLDEARQGVGKAQERTSTGRHRKTVPRKNSSWPELRDEDRGKVLAPERSGPDSGRGPGALSRGESTPAVEKARRNLDAALHRLKVLREEARRQGVLPGDVRNAERLGGLREGY